jgi:hypothetical protein
MKGKLLIVLGFLGIVGILVFKNIKHTLVLIGPKSSVGFIVCIALIIIGARMLPGKAKV